MKNSPILPVCLKYLTVCRELIIVKNNSERFKKFSFILCKDFFVFFKTVPIILLIIHIVPEGQALLPCEIIADESCLSESFVGEDPD